MNNTLSHCYKLNHNTKKQKFLPTALLIKFICRYFKGTFKDFTQVDKCYGVILGTIDFQKTIRYSCITYQNAKKTHSICLFFATKYLFRFIRGSNGKIK